VLRPPLAFDDDQVVEQLGEVVAAEPGFALLPLSGETLAQGRRTVADQFGLQLVGVGLAQAARLRAGVGVACLSTVSVVMAASVILSWNSIRRLRPSGLAHAAARRWRRGCG
jgi:hypothetical protein